MKLCRMGNPPNLYREAYEWCINHAKPAWHTSPDGLTAVCDEFAQSSGCKCCLANANKATRNNDPENYQNRAKRVLIKYIDDGPANELGERPAYEVYIVWFTKTLQNWKALLSTDQPNGKYYELTYNGDKGETYVDEYEHIRNTVIAD